MSLLGENIPPLIGRKVLAVLPELGYELMIGKRFGVNGARLPNLVTPRAVEPTVSGVRASLVATVDAENHASEHRAIPPVVRGNGLLG